MKYSSIEEIARLRVLIDLPQVRLIKNEKNAMIIASKYFNTLPLEITSSTVKDFKSRLNRLSVKSIFTLEINLWKNVDLNIF